jgi:hypothetical protein
VKSSWDWFSPRENCIDILRFFVISSWISTIIDIVIWGFPLPHFFKLQMKPRRKFHLVLLFGAGALYIFFSPPSLTENADYDLAPSWLGYSAFLGLMDSVPWILLVRSLLFADALRLT